MYKKIGIVMPMFNLRDSILIRRHQQVCGNTIETNQLETLIVKLLIFLITIIVLHSNLKRK